MPLPVPCCRQSPRAPRFIARRCRQRGPKAAGPRQARGGRTAWSRRGRFAGSCRLPRSAHGLRSEHRPEACLARPHFRALPAHPPASAGPLPARGCGAEGRLGVNFYFKRGKKKKFLTPLDTASRWRRWRPYHVTGERGSGDRRGGVSPLCRRLSAVTMGTGPRCWQRAPQSGPDVCHRPDSNISLFMALRRG